MPVKVIDSDKKAEKKQKEMRAVEFVKKLKELEELQIKGRGIGTSIPPIQMGTCYCQD